ncbi:hypothetical protein N657DRAFT_271364 [Parathielavia appendiculata]|uniref:Uncharacterized protein n=1 Tax=Parathielavia appendiculata TaxID=2587402 RepID=A0AAN6U3M9_9PEZI|nr:hypothetical protein N657DRAFT_271364 [Parathielavia appendiculata]
MRGFHENAESNTCSQPQHALGGRRQYFLRSGPPSHQMCQAPRVLHSTADLANSLCTLNKSLKSASAGGSERDLSGYGRDKLYRAASQHRVLSNEWISRGPGRSEPTSDGPARLCDPMQSRCGCQVSVLSPSARLIEEDLICRLSECVILS